MDKIFNEYKIESNENIITLKDKLEETQICAILEIYDKYIIIQELNKCNKKSGTETLMKIEEFGKILGKEKIKLYDTSQIKIICEDKTIEISLALLKILSTGRTWYNTKGYFDINQDKINTHIQEIIHLTMNDFLDRCLEEYKKRHLDIIKSINEKKFIDETFRHDSIVIDFFIDINKVININTDCIKLDKICRLMNFIKNSNFVNYGFLFIKILE